MKILDPKTHGVLDYAPAIGFAEDTAARNFYVAAGIGLLAVVAITDYKGRGTAEARSRSGVRHA
jgi:hypothetical protein